MFDVETGRVPVSGEHDYKVSLEKGPDAQMWQVIRSPKVYDVCIIGSGAGGGMAAKVLTEGGLTVALLEAGPPLNPDKDFKEHVWPYELPHRGAGIGGNALKPG